MMHYDESRIYEKILPILFFVAMLIFSGSLTIATAALGVFFPGGIVVSRILAKQKRPTAGMASLFAVFAAYVAVILFVMLIEYGIDLDPESITEPITNEIKLALGDVYSLLQGSPFVAGLTQANFVYTFYITILCSLPTMMGLLILATSALCYWTTKAIICKKERADLEKTQFFGSFDLIRISHMGGVIYTLSSLMATFSSTTNEAIIFGTVTSIMSVVLCYAGASLIAFIMKMKGATPIFRYFIYALIFILCFNSTVRSLLSLIGLIDCFWHLRRFVPPSARYL
jgi:hypothetical protein